MPREKTIAERLADYGITYMDPDRGVPSRKQLIWNDQFICRANVGEAIALLEMLDAVTSSSHPKSITIDSDHWGVWE
jgi:hypothetical protein